MPVYVTIPGFKPSGTPDPLINEGSLLYVSPAHREGKWAGDLTTVPAFGEPLPNIAYAQAAAMIGTGTKATLSPALTQHGGFTPGGPGGKLERTSKGAFHAIMSKTADTVGLYMSIAMPDLIRAYLQTAQSHGIYMGIVGKVTRVGGAGAFLQRISVGSTSRMSIEENPSGNLQSSPNMSAPNMLGKSANTPIPGPFLMDLATSSVPAGWPGGLTAPALNFFGPYGASVHHLSPSYVIYAIYIEDLTVSGLTYAQAHAKMQAFVTAQVETPGGMYYGDTNTAPSTVP